MKTNLFNRNKASVSLKPFSYLGPSVHTSSKFFFALILPQVIMLVLVKNFSALAVVLAATAASCLDEAVFSRMNRNYPENYFIACVQGLLTGLLVPCTYPPFAVFFVTAVAFALTKYISGGFASSWVNPVALSVAVLYLLKPSIFPAIPLTRVQLAAKNPSLALIQNGSIGAMKTDSAITSFFNGNIFSFFGISVPDGYATLFWDSESVIPAFRFNLITIISSIILFSFEIVNAVIPVVFVVCYSILVRIFAPAVLGGDFFSGDVLLCLLTSGTLFCSTFLLQWYGTTPLTFAGKILYAVTAALFAFAVMGAGISSAGFVFTILLMNLISPLIQLAENKHALSRVRVTLHSRLMALKEA